MEPPTNSQAGPAPDGAATAATESIGRVAAEVAARHAPGLDPATGRRPPGRPRKDGLPAGSLAGASRPVGQSPTPAGPALAGPQAPSAPAPVYLISPEFIGTLVEGAANAFQDGRQRKAFLRVLKYTGDRALAQDIAREAAAPPGTIQTVKVSSIELGRKYADYLQYSPEVAILAALGVWMIKDRSFFASLEQRLKPKEAPKPATPAPDAAGTPA